MTVITEGHFQDQPAYVLETDWVRLVVLPQISGKIVSLVDKASGEELLWRNPDRGYRQPVYGDAFADYDTSGWEDCLPNIAAGRYPEWPWEDAELPDHGEVWTLPWQTRVDGDALELSVHGVRLPYHFEKRISLAGNRVRLDHRLINPTAFPIRYIWATHPLFDVRPGMQIVLPEGVSVRIDSSKQGRLGSYLQELSWPATLSSSGDRVQLDLIGDPDQALADKLFTSPVSEGWCGLYDPERRRAIGMTFDPEQLPYIGVWINQGGFPPGGPPSFNLGLEPCSGFPDALDVAVKRGFAPTVEPGETNEWWIELQSGEAGSVRELLDI
jgi:galactose mutarotase-like enzyme